MGVRGLTTFINSNSHMYFMKFKLHDCILVIDGNSLAAVLYSETLGPYSAFGGDYDLFADHIENFVSNLKMCKVQPIFIFDGGYEKKKATTVRKRNAMKVFVVEKVSPDRPARDFFPYMMRPVLQERLMELEVTCLQSDYEADREIAAIAKRLNAPVLSNDSDFFIFDVPFIPFSGFSFDVCEDSSQTNDVFYYMPCHIFTVDNFLKSFGGLDKAVLPLLATVLGNDYLNRSVFKNFYGLIKTDKNKKVKLGHRRVVALVKWLKNENFETALNKILASLPKNHRQRMKHRITTIISGYADLTTCLDQFLPEISIDKQEGLTFDTICSQLKNMSISDLKNSNDCEENFSEEEIEITENTHLEESEDEKVNEEEEIEDLMPSSVSNQSELPQWLLERSRQCQIAPQIITLFTLKTYFCVPQLEDCNLPNAGEIGLPILEIIAGLTLGSQSVTYWHRHGSNAYRSKTVEAKNTYKEGMMLPCLSKLNNTSLLHRKEILMHIMKLENECILDSFPENWHLLIISLEYWLKSRSSLRPYHIHAVIMMIIIVNIHQSKIGLFRKRKSFMKKYSAKVKSLEKLREATGAKYIDVRATVTQILSEITIDDCLITFEIFLPYFDIDISLKQRPRTFQRAIIHTFAELQIILDLAQTLNSLLLYPYKRMLISKLYNGTFLYNIAANFKCQPDIITFLEKLYKKAPIFLNLHMSFYNKLYQYSNRTDLVPQILPSKKRKKRRKRVGNNHNSDIDELSEDNENFQDENNKFSLLQTTIKL